MIKEESDIEVLKAENIVFHPRNKKPPNKLFEIMRYNNDGSIVKNENSRCSTEMQIKEICKFSESMSLYDVDQTLYNMLVDDQMFVASKY